MDLREMYKKHTDAGHTDPRIIAHLVASQIPASDRVEVLEKLLPWDIMDHWRSDRKRLQHPHESEGIKKSAKWLSAKKHWPDMRYHVKDGWKALYDLTRDDCIYLRDHYLSAAEANQQRGDNFDTLAKKMKSGQKVGDLNQSTVMKVLGVRGE